jgi:putative ABC transport system substrate-binding protein
MSLLLTQSGHWGPRLIVFQVRLTAESSVRRRNFIKGVAVSATGWPLAARAQKPAMPVIGFFRSTSSGSSEHLVAAFEEGLKATGFVEGQNVAIEFRWGNDQSERLARLAADLVRLRPALITGNVIAMRAVIAASTEIPIVFVSGSDPVRVGLVETLNHPGGNVTGVTWTSSDLAAKRLGLLHDLVPKPAPVAALFDPNAPSGEFGINEVEKGGQTIGRTILIMKASDASEFPDAFAKMIQQNAGGLFIGSSAHFLSHRRQLAALATRYAMPSSAPTREFADAGMLMSYGGSQSDAYRRAGSYAGRILKGDMPANMPVELATKLELVINLATAKAFGLTIPANLLTLADEVIE